MSELKPTMENLSDPYVLQLIETISKLEDQLHGHDNTPCPICGMEDEIQRLTALVEADGKEIGSYREGTGLRGENKAQAEQLIKLEGDLEVMRLQRDAKYHTDSKDPVCDINGCMHQQHFNSIRKLQGCIAELEETVLELGGTIYAKEKEDETEIPDPPF